MKTLSTLFLALLVTTGLQAQTPAKSPTATLQQKVGLTDVTLVYSRPDADGRKIFGDLVPYNELWRTGANKATQITFSDDVTINNETVPAGSYSLFTIPGKDKWTVILNKETELWGTGDFDKAQDQLRFTVNATSTGEHYETFTIDFADLEMESANMVLTWEKTRLSFKIGVNAAEQAWANVEQSIEEYESNWRVYVRAASYAAETGKNLDKALTWIDKALEIEDEYWWTYMVQSEVYAAQKDYKNAAKAAKKCMKYGEKNENWPYKGRVEKMLKEYEAKS